MWSDYGGGGGFMNTTQASPSDQKKPQRASQAYVPCSIAQVYTAESHDEAFKVNGVEIGTVSLVGLVRKVEQANTSITYHLDDGTGPCIEIRQWLDTEDGEPKVHNEHSYIKVSGSIRTFQGKRNIMAYRIEALSEMNELTLHLIEIAHSHLMMQNKSCNPSNQGDATGMPHQNARTSGYNAVGTADHGLTGVEKQVFEIITSVHNDIGISIKDIQGCLKSTPQMRLRKAIDFLSDEGHIYSTIDDDHFKSTSADE